ncbi:MAG: hypothetical protein IPL89_17335 [Acidobacteria bacterium]|nr:hypothetical protein [Acidobacteriota bacterium]
MTSSVAAEKGRVRVAFEVTIPASSLALLPAANARVAKIAAFVALLDKGVTSLQRAGAPGIRTGEDAFADAEDLSRSRARPSSTWGRDLDRHPRRGDTGVGHACIEVPGPAKK